MNYPLLNVFWTMLEFFFWIVWIYLVVRIISDIFRSRDLNGFAKAAWALFVILLPFIGVLGYVLVRGGEMHERDDQQRKAQDDALRAYVQQTPGTPASSNADELTKLAQLQRDGVLTPSEFATQKAKLLNLAPVPNGQHLAGV
jgi:phospholipase D-like protein